MHHYLAVDPSNEWKRGIVGYLVTGWAISLQIIIKLTISGMFLIYVHWGPAVAVLGVGGAVLAWVLSVRHYSLQRLESDISLHSIFHQSRDDIARLPLPSDQTYRHCLDEFHRNTAQRLAQFFRERIASKKVNCAIRLAKATPQGQCYATVARSDGMDVSRSMHSQPIPSDKGLALALLEQQQSGVYIIKDISKEIGSPLWHGSRNDKLPDVKSLMAAPINGWNGEQRVMLGILYVTAPNDIFEPGDTLPVKAFADYLGLVYPIILRTQG